MIFNLQPDYKEFDLNWFHDARCSYVEKNMYEPKIILMHPGDGRKFKKAIIEHYGGFIGSDEQLENYYNVRLIEAYRIKEETFEMFGENCR